MKPELQLMSLLISGDSRRTDNSWLFLVVPGINSTARMRAQAGYGLRLMIAQAGLAVRLVEQLMPGKQLFLAKGGQGSLPCFGKQWHG